MPRKASSPRFPRPDHAGRSRNYLLGPQQRKQQLARLRFGRHVFLLTADELRQLTATADRYIESRGSAFGFVTYLLSHVRA